MPTPTDLSKLTLAEKVLEHVAVSNLGLTKAAAAEKAHNEKQAQVNAIIPRVVEVMVANERILPSQQEKLAAMLADPVTTLELLMKVAAHRNADELAKLGSGVNGQVKAAASRNRDPSDSLTNPHVGARTTRLKQSSVALFSGLGLQPPTQE